MDKEVKLNDFEMDIYNNIEIEEDDSYYKIECPYCESQTLYKKDYILDNDHIVECPSCEKEFKTEEL